jgi:hypothetical protein
MDGSSCVSCVSSRLSDLLRRAADRSRAEVKKHRGTHVPGEYRSPAFMFARILKAEPEFSGLDAEAATALVDCELDKMYPECPAPWVALGLPDMDTREEKAMDPRTGFLGVWDTITTPFNVDHVVDQAARMAKTQRIDLGGRFAHRNDHSFVELLNLCHCMALLCKGSFYLSCREAGRVLGINHATANQHLRRAMGSGFLRGEKYDERERANRKAKRWTFHLAKDT